MISPRERELLADYEKAQAQSHPESYLGSSTELSFRGAKRRGICTYALKCRSLASLGMTFFRGSLAECNRDGARRWYEAAETTDMPRKPLTNAVLTTRADCRNTARCSSAPPAEWRHR
jgi:hypothetical protein